MTDYYNDWIWWGMDFYGQVSCTPIPDGYCEVSISRRGEYKVIYKGGNAEEVKK